MIDFAEIRKAITATRRERARARWPLLGVVCLTCRHVMIVRANPRRRQHPRGLTACPTCRSRPDRFQTVAIPGRAPQSEHAVREAFARYAAGAGLAPDVTAVLMAAVAAAERRLAARPLLRGAAGRTVRIGREQRALSEARERKAVAAREAEERA